MKTINSSKDFLKKNFDGVTAYTQSKLALMIFTIDLAEELKVDNVTVMNYIPERISIQTWFMMQV